ncbi:hypothetical protein VNO78_21533 [Psophocarpus tetragonolobus]|uniref:Uncharacterized protein n=1 Tax=Psophocarpus tetragonolobus TaxID=3891 RepID=A0AAN9XIA8_PSOTE
MLVLFMHHRNFALALCVGIVNHTKCGRKPSRIVNRDQMSFVELENDQETQLVEPVVSRILGTREFVGTEDVVAGGDGSVEAELRPSLEVDLVSSRAEETVGPVQGSINMSLHVADDSSKVVALGSDQKRCWVLVLNKESEEEGNANKALRVTHLLDEYKCPYSIFVSKALERYGVDTSNEAREFTKDVYFVKDKALKMMKLIKIDEGWMTKKEMQLEDESMEPKLLTPFEEMILK